MNLLNFIFRSYVYALLLVFCALVLFWVPYFVEVYGVSHEWERVLCWVFAPVPLTGLLVGANDHRRRMHILALERGWYEANHNMNTTTDHYLQQHFLALRKNPLEE